MVAHKAFGLNGARLSLRSWRGGLDPATAQQSLRPGCRRGFSGQWMDVPPATASPRLHPRQRATCHRSFCQHRSGLGNAIQPEQFGFQGLADRFANDTPAHRRHNTKIPVRSALLRDFLLTTRMRLQGHFPDKISPRNKFRFRLPAQPEVPPPTRHVRSTPETKHRYPECSGPFRAKPGSGHIAFLRILALPPSRHQKIQTTGGTQVGGAFVSHIQLIFFQK